mmetsp:Transcript_79318/g.206081  ORF Transcript_79318/g.206081 Transcript_79318/m.206081 type:complete len:258 (+) Transcript_79318:244-1017(+)
MISTCGSSKPPCTFALIISWIRSSNLSSLNIVSMRRRTFLITMSRSFSITWSVWMRSASICSSRSQLARARPQGPYRSSHGSGAAVLPVTGVVLAAKVAMSSSKVLIGTESLSHSSGRAKESAATTSCCKRGSGWAAAFLPLARRATRAARSLWPQLAKARWRWTGWRKRAPQWTREASASKTATSSIMPSFWFSIQWEDSLVSLRDSSMTMCSSLRRCRPLAPDKRAPARASAIQRAESLTSAMTQSRAWQQRKMA